MNGNWRWEKDFLCPLNGKLNKPLMEVAPSHSSVWWCDGCEMKSTSPKTLSSPNEIIRTKGSEHALLSSFLSSVRLNSTTWENLLFETTHTIRTRRRRRRWITKFNSPLAHRAISRCHWLLYPSAILLLLWLFQEMSAAIPKRIASALLQPVSDWQMVLLY